MNEILAGVSSVRKFKSRSLLYSGLTILLLLFLYRHLNLTDVSIKLKIRRLILFYSIDPHCIGIRWWTPARPIDWTWIQYLQPASP